MSITAADVGSRVMIRRRLLDGRGGFGDVIGDLLEWTDDTLVIAARSGQVTVRLETVVAGKRVPPAPRRHSGAGP